MGGVAGKESQHCGSFFRSYSLDHTKSPFVREAFYVLCVRRRSRKRFTAFRLEVVLLLGEAADLLLFRITGGDKKGIYMISSLGEVKNHRYIIYHLFSRLISWKCLSSRMQYISRLQENSIFINTNWGFSMGYFMLQVAALSSVNAF